jgi:hypothetical protein
MLAFEYVTPTTLAFEHVHANDANTAHDQKRPTSTLSTRTSDKYIHLRAQPGGPSSICIRAARLTVCTSAAPCIALPQHLHIPGTPSPYFTYISILYCFHICALCSLPASLYNHTPTSKQEPAAAPAPTSPLGPSSIPS